MHAIVRQASRLSANNFCKRLPIRTRRFHATPRLQSSFVEACCSQSFEILNTIHSTTGLPWVYVLPISAILLRTTVVLPLSFWSRKHLCKIQDVQPILAASVPSISKTVKQDHPTASTAEAIKIVQKRIKEKSAELYKRFGIRRWTQFLPFAQLPFFLVAMETIRQMSSDTTGLLGLLAQYLPFTLEKRLPMETSLSNEGALWFTDLLAPDPYYILPAIVSVMLYSSVAYQDRVQRLMSASITERRDMISITLKSLAIGSYYFTLQFPTAMMVYWASSSAYALLCSYIVDKTMPLKPIIRPCPPLKKPFILNSTGGQDQQEPESFWTRFKKANL